jgi:tetratricopeptide (TPR) repeat protein
LLRNFTLFFLFLVLPWKMSSARQSNVDSLRQALLSAQGEAKIDLLVELSFALSQRQPELAIAEANKAYHLSVSMNYQRGMASALHKRAVVYRYQGYYDEAIAASDSALAIQEAQPWPELDASCLGRNQLYL